MRSPHWPAVCTPAPLCKIAARSLQDAMCCGVSRGSCWACAPLLRLRGRLAVHEVPPGLWPAPRVRWAARSHSPAPRPQVPTAKLQEDLGVRTRGKRVLNLFTPRVESAWRAQLTVVSSCSKQLKFSRLATATCVTAVAALHQNWMGTRKHGTEVGTGVSTPPTRPHIVHTCTPPRTRIL